MKISDADHEAAKQVANKYSEVLSVLGREAQTGDISAIYDAFMQGVQWGRDHFNESLIKCTKDGAEYYANKPNAGMFIATENLDGNVNVNLKIGDFALAFVMHPDNAVDCARVLLNGESDARSYLIEEFQKQEQEKIS